MWRFCFLFPWPRVIILSFFSIGSGSIVIYVKFLPIRTFVLPYSMCLYVGVLVIQKFPTPPNPAQPNQAAFVFGITIISLLCCLCCVNRHVQSMYGIEYLPVFKLACFNQLYMAFSLWSMYQHFLS